MKHGGTTKSMKYYKITRSMSWDPQVLERLEQAAIAQTGGNVSLLVSIICKRYLDRLEKKMGETGEVFNG